MKFKIQVFLIIISGLFLISINIGFCSGKIVDAAHGTSESSNTYYDVHHEECSFNCYCPGMELCDCCEASVWYTEGVHGTKIDVAMSYDDLTGLSGHADRSFINKRADWDDSGWRREVDKTYRLDIMCNEGKCTECYADNQASDCIDITPS